MNLCMDPVIGDLVDPATDYFDNAVSSTYSAPNECEYLDPNDPNGVAVISFTQDLTALRATAGLRGDVNCDNTINVVDSLMIAQYSVGNRTDSGSCPLNDPATEINVSNGDFNVEAGADVVDSLLIAQCSVGAGNPILCN